MEKYVENLYKILFEFDFSDVSKESPIYKGMLTLIWTSLFLYLPNHALPSGMNEDILYLGGIGIYLIGILFVWAISAIFFDFIAKIFGNGGKIRHLLNLSAYTLLPYIFMAPFEILKNSSKIGYFFGTKLEILLLVWVIILYTKSLANTYNLSKSSSIMLVFIPTIAIGFAFIWLIGTCFNIGYIYTV